MGWGRSSEAVLEATSPLSADEGLRSSWGKGSGWGARPGGGTAAPERGSCRVRRVSCPDVRAVSRCLDFRRRPKGAELVLSAEDGIPAVPGRGRGCRSRGDPKMGNRLLTKMPPPPKLCRLGTGSQRLPRPLRPDPSSPRLSRKPSLGSGEVGGTAGFY